MYGIAMQNVTTLQMTEIIKTIFGGVNNSQCIKYIMEKNLKFIGVLQICIVNKITPT